jgi:hypothetical protein
MYWVIIILEQTAPLQITSRWVYHCTVNVILNIAGNQRDMQALGATRKEIRK